MLKGHFKNCYGLRDFELKEINFDGEGKNKAIIYSPNGVMKTSLALTLADIKMSKRPIDRLFPNRESEFKLTYRNKTLTNNSQTEDMKSSNIYVVMSMQEDYKSDSISTLLVDEELKVKYNKILEELDKDIKGFEKNLSTKSKVTTKNIREILFSDFGMKRDDEWVDLFVKLKNELQNYDYKSELENIRYLDILNPQTEKIFQNENFIGNIQEYLAALDDIISNSKILSIKFDNHNFIELANSIKKNDLFSAKHGIIMRSGENILRKEEWESKVKEELEEIEKSPRLNDIFSKIDKLINDTEKGITLKNILRENKFLLPYLNNIIQFKKVMWLNYLANNKDDFYELCENFEKYLKDIKEIYKEANKEREQWEKIVEEFNERFKVPFKAKVENQANVLLKGEAPNVVFIYPSGEEGVEDAVKTQDYLMNILSNGEKRALYLLQILFDIEKIEQHVNNTGEHYLVVVDDIADSFDYKNKYAIIEYLKEISDNPLIDLLILTHNFDFYRTSISRIKIKGKNSYIVQKNTHDKLFMASKFSYRDNIFKDEVVNGISDGIIGDDIDKKKWLIASIPFFRNLAEFSGKELVYKHLTSLLHMKENTNKITIAELWADFKEINSNLGELQTNEDEYEVIKLLEKLTKLICNNLMEDISLENKIILSISIRIEAEKFMFNRLKNVGKEVADCEGDQTKRWYDAVKCDLSKKEKEILEQVNIMTPENIHLNAFMYEPIIDLSDWHLKDLYEKVKGLNNHTVTSIEEAAATSLE